MLLPGFTLNEVPIYTSNDVILCSGIEEESRKPVAIKVLKSEHPSTADIERVKHEYEVIKSLKSAKGVIRTYGLKKHHHGYAIILENIFSRSLREILSLEKKISLKEFLEIAILITKTLGQVFKHHIINKNINPANILYNREKKEITLIDFGLAITLPREKATVINPKIIEGTIAYLSPEQTGRMNRGIDYRTDFYSLGITFYEMITGKLPFADNDFMTLIHSHIAAVPEPPHQVDPSIPKVVSDIIMKLIEKNAEDRYQSTYGLLKDLKNCRDQLKETGQILSFPLAEQDIFNYFQIPEKLYGRQNEINLLLKTYDMVTQGHAEMMLVTGYAGIGKSSLVNEIHKPVTANRGFFISGKYQQFRRNIPYDAFVQAFNELVKQILTESEEHIAEFKENIQQALGENADIVIEVIPNLASIIGKQPPVPKLGPTESQNRFNYVFQNFIRSLATREHPLVLFLDDLQWADLSSLALIETLLTNDDCKYLFIIGAYRDNEVNSFHPLIMKIDELKKRQVVNLILELTPLQFTDVLALLADSLHQNEREKLQELGKICYEKCGGNPFFLIQLLQELYKEKLIKFSSIEIKWTWDLDQIKNMKITDNVASLMTAKIKQLSVNAQKIMQLASCIGNTFDLDLLAKIYSVQPGKAFLDLEEILKEGYIICYGQAYTATKFKFAHDRIQQAAYYMLDEKNKKNIHLKIARLLLQFTAEDKLNEAIFNIVNHFNTALDLSMDDPMNLDSEEMITIAKLNLRASSLVKQSAAFEFSLTYIQYAIKFSSRCTWELQYELMRDIYCQAMESAYLTTKFELVEKYAKIALDNVNNILDQHKIIELKIYSYIAQNKLPDALNLALQAAKQLGINIPLQPSNSYILSEILKLKLMLLRKNISDLADLPEMTDEVKKSLIRLLAIASTPAYIIAFQCCIAITCLIVTMSLKYGNTKQSAVAYSAFGMMLVGLFGDYETGYALGNTSLALLDKLHDEEFRVEVSAIAYGYLKVWKDDIHSILPKLIEAFEKGLSQGNLEFACYSILLYVNYSLLSGANLKELLAKLEKFNSRIYSLRHTFSFIIGSLYQQVILNLIGPNEKPYLFTGKAFNEAIMLPEILKTEQRVGILIYNYQKLMNNYLFGNTSESLQHIITFEKYMKGNCNYFIPSFYLYKSLTLLSNYSSASFFQKIRIRINVASAQKQLKKLENLAPMNLANKYYLVEAERLWRIKNKPEEAIRFFDKAIELAKQNDCIHEEALANELAARVYFSIQNNKIAMQYLEEAQHCYQVWGADAKVAYLKQSYQQLLSKNKTATADITQSGKTILEALDINSILKSSEAFMGTILLPDLLKKLMSIVVLNSGAEKCLLLLNNKGKFTIEAEVKIGYETITVLESKERTADLVPNLIINYVINTKELLVLDNAAQTNKFEEDPYIIANQSKSILCMPLINQGVLIGVLYLENNLAKGAFVQKNIEVLKILSSQMAISINNAKLFSDTLALNKRLRILNTAYERFLPADFVSFLNKKSIIDVKLGDQVQETMTVLFADMRNYTTISENMTPQDNIDFLNEFLSVISPIIERHHGFIDKYIGDAIMALYPQSADDAVECALDIHQVLNAYNIKTIRKGKNPIQIGIGINTGTLMLGTIGIKNRMNITVISDAVNVASRIESLTKQYGLPILITNACYKKLKSPERYRIEFIDNIQVKGKSTKIAIYAIHGYIQDKLQPLPFRKNLIKLK